MSTSKHSAPTNPAAHNNSILNNSTNTSILAGDEVDPKTHELEKTKNLLEKKEEALKYLKKHYIKLKKKGVSTGINMLARLARRKAVEPGFR